MPRSGYTLPVFAVAGARAAALHLQSPHTPIQPVTLDLLPGTAEIPIEQVACLEPGRALAITLSDPGDNLDLTRGTPIWSCVRLHDRRGAALILEGGEGLGRSEMGPAIYRYARQLFEANLAALIPEDRAITVTIALPEGRQLAGRTANAAFGVIDGLALLGTSGISEPLSVESHLIELRQALQQKAQHSRHLVFCIGSHGSRVAEGLGIPAQVVVQTGNWIGALLVAAGLYGVESVLLLGYHGKLIKLAGGIFNTSSHLADAKLEILSAAVIRHGDNGTLARTILEAKTADAACGILAESGCAEAIFADLTQRITARAREYVRKYANVDLRVNTTLFDRQGRILAGRGAPWE